MFIRSIILVLIYFGAARCALVVGDASSVHFRVPLYKSINFQTYNSHVVTPYYGIIEIGNPGQKFKVAFDSNNQFSWVISSECAIPSCKNLHTSFNGSMSSSYQNLSTSIEREYDAAFVSGFSARDLLSLGESPNEVRLEDQAIGQTTYIEGLEFKLATFDGIIGLNFGDLMDKLMEKNLISNPVFSVKLNRYQNYEPGGELTFGLVDESQFSGQITYTPVTAPNRWQFKLDRIFTSHHDLFSVGYIEGSETVCETGCLAEPATLSTLISGPEGDIKRLNEYLGMELLPSGEFVLTGDCDLTKLPDLVFTIEGRDFVLFPDDYILKIMNKDNRILCKSALTISKRQDQIWLLGDLFVGRFFTIFDYGNKRIGFAETKN